MRKLLKAELGDVLTAGVNSSNDATYNILLANRQEFFYQIYDWPHLEIKTDIPLPSQTRYIDFPATQIEVTKTWSGSVKFGNRWIELDKGIDEGDYNLYDSDNSFRADFVRKIDLYNQEPSGTQQLEVWPVPATLQLLRLTGTRPLPDLVSDDDVCVLDHLLIVMFTAADILSLRKQANAQAKLSQATQLLNRLRGAAPARNSVFIMGGSSSEGETNRSLNGRPTIAITPTQ